MLGELPEVTGEAKPMKVEDNTWWAARVLKLRLPQHHGPAKSRILLRAFAALHPWLHPGMLNHRVPDELLMAPGRPSPAVVTDRCLALPAPAIASSSHLAPNELLLAPGRPSPAGVTDRCLAHPAPEKKHHHHL